MSFRKHLFAIATTIAVLGSVSVLRPGSAHAQPPRGDCDAFQASKIWDEILSMCPNNVAFSAECDGESIEVTVYLCN